MQLLACAEEELGIKRRLADRLEHMDKEFNENMTRLSTNMEKFTNAISFFFFFFNNIFAKYIGKGCMCIATGANNKT